MTDTRLQLIESAQTLFLEQGFAKTTIQQIAEHAGISKGAVYLHFRSKSQLLLAIMEKIGDDILDGVRQIRDREDLSPRDKLLSQLRYQFEDVLENQRLMEVYLKESAIAIDEELLLLAQKVRLEWQQMQEDFLLMAFPDQDKEFLSDLTVILNGALNEYYSYILLDGADLDAERVAGLLLAMAEVMTERLARGDLKPALKPASLPGREELEAKLAEAVQRRISQAFDGMLEQAKTMAPEDAVEIADTIELMRGELDREGSNRIVLQGLLANLRDFKALLPQRRELAAELGLKLL